MGYLNAPRRPLEPRVVAIFTGQQPALAAATDSYWLMWVEADVCSCVLRRNQYPDVFREAVAGSDGQRLQ